MTVKAKGFRDCVCVFGNREKPAFASSEWGGGAVRCRLIRSDSWGHGTVLWGQLGASGTMWRKGNEEERKIKGEIKGENGK